MWEGSPLPFPRPCLFLHLYVCVPNLAPFCFLLLAPHRDHCTLLFAHCVCPRLCLEAMAGGGPGPMCCRAALFSPWAVCGSAPCCTVLYTSAWPPPHCLLTSFPFFVRPRSTFSRGLHVIGGSPLWVLRPPPPPVSCPLSPLSCPPCCCGLGLLSVLGGCCVGGAPYWRGVVRQRFPMQLLPRGNAVAEPWPILRVSCVATIPHTTHFVSRLP